MTSVPAYGCEPARKSGPSNRWAKIIVRRERIWALCLGLTCSLSASVRAEVHVEGNPAAVRITTSQAAISDVLLSFPASFKLKYRSAIPLDDPVQEAYAGSFRQVISRLLDGYNYVVRTREGATEVVVFGKNGEVAIPPPEPEEPPDQEILAQWR
jgi:hypothetical protein